MGRVDALRSVADRLSRSFATVAVLIVSVYALAESSDSPTAVGGVVCLLAAGTIVALRGLGVAGRLGPVASAAIASIGGIASVGSATGTDAVVVPAVLAALAFSLVAPAMILRHIMRASAIDNEIIAAAISLYLLVGILFGTAFTFVAHYDPTAFDPPQAMTADRTSSLYYFSFVTLTTVGFGDVVPAAGVARTLVVIEALVGQVVLVALVARLVGMQASAATRAAADHMSRTTPGTGDTATEFEPNVNSASRPRSDRARTFTQARGPVG